MSSGWCLFLDVDGTLLELAARPADVRVDEALRELLTRVSSALNGAVALVSGRSITQLDQLFAPARWPAAGLHGLERRDAAGRMHLAKCGESGDRQLLTDLVRVAATVSGALVEDKGAAIALHYRGAPQAAGRLRSAAAKVVTRLGSHYTVLEGNMVLEILPVGATKASAIRDFLTEPPFAGRRPIFLGDDVTDAGALDEVARLGGLSVAVGGCMQAMRTVAGPREVRGFLTQLATSGSPT